VLICITAAIDYRAYPYGAAIGGPSRNKGDNGLWLKYTWYLGEHSVSDMRQLADQMRSRQIRFVYFHVRSVGKDGRLEHRYGDKGRALTSEIHRRATGVKLIAWAYAPTDSQHAVRLSDSKTRKMMVAEALWLVNYCGFDGVQWDVEPCPDGDSGFISLLRETKAALPRGKLLSIAAPMWQPAGLRRFGWSDFYFYRVAANCDQVVVMCYDSGFYMPRAYVWLVSQQAIRVTHEVGESNPNCKVLLGVPTYGDGLRSHNPRAENLPNGLRGVRDGLDDPGSNVAAFSGVAIFADSTTTARDWDMYERLWLSN
jgi:hypothetical protein